MRGRIRKIVSITLAIALVVASGFSVQETKADSYTKIFNVSTNGELVAAYEEINADTSGKGNYLININANLPAGAYMEFMYNKTTINGNNHTLNAPDMGNILYVSNNDTEVTVNDATFIGTTTNDNPGVFYALNGGKITMNEGVTIKDACGQNYFGGAVSVADAKFVMNGGTIENCGIRSGGMAYGGGVGVFNGSVFIMNGGTIKNCYVTNPDYSTNFYAPATAGGGVFVCLSSAFIMNGGKIENCRAEAGGAVGGGVACQAHLQDRYTYGSWGNISCRFNMAEGASITGCSATEVGGGIYIGGYYIQPIPVGTVVQLEFPESYTPGFEFNKCSISNNSVSADDGIGGGAVGYFWDKRTTTFTNVTFDGNEAPAGGGMFVYDGYTAPTLTNCTITNNEAYEVGGGICAANNNNSAGTTLDGCTITDNISGDIGAGVYYDAPSKINIKGANTIQDNTYDGKQNNLNIYEDGYPVYVTGSLSGSKIGLSDPTLWDDGKPDDDPTAVSTDKLTSGYKTNNSGIDPSEVFTSDHITWIPGYSEDGTEARLIKKTFNCKFKGANITLDGKIGVNFYAFLDDKDSLTPAELAKYKVKMTVYNDKQSASVYTVPSSKATYDAAHDCYIFSCYMAATKMADNIEAEIIYDSQETGVTKNYSVRTYALNIIGKDSIDADAKSVCKSMLNYGAYSQKYFGYRTDYLANKDCDFAGDVEKVTSIDEKYRMSVDNNLNGFEVTSYNLGIDNGINVRLRVKLDPIHYVSDYTATLAGEEGEDDLFMDDNGNLLKQINLPFTSMEESVGKDYLLSINNMPANRFSNMMKLTISDNNNSSNKCEINFSVLSYAYDVVNENATDGMNLSNSEKENLRNLMKSIYLYNESAYPYFVNNGYVKDNNDQPDNE